MPPGVDVTIETRYGEVDIDGSFGNVLCDLRAGEIHVRTPRANVRDHSIEKEGLFAGGIEWSNAAGKSDMRVHTTFGEVHVTLTR